MAKELFIPNSEDENGVEEEESGGDQDDERDSEDDEEENEIVEEDEADGVDSDEERQKEKKRKNRESERNCVLNKDDYISEDCSILESKKFKQLKKARMDAKYDPPSLTDEEEFEGSGKGGCTSVKELCKESTGPLPTDEISIKLEAKWIYNQLVNGMVTFYNKSSSTSKEVDDELKNHLTRFLELMHVQKLDIPFIAMYRKEEILSLLKDPNEPDPGIDSASNQKPTLKWHKVLWSIEDLDSKWLHLQERKTSLRSYYSKQFKEDSETIYDEAHLNLKRQLFDSIIKSLNAADIGIEVDDVCYKFDLHFPFGESVLDEGLYTRISHCSICSKSGLLEIARKFGYTSEQFGLQIFLEKMRMDKLEDAKETPEEVAAVFTCVMFKTPQAVLKGARHKAAVEISCEPNVRKHVRSIFMENAVVSTCPTPDGNTAIGTFHQLAGVKWLGEKPLDRFNDAQWLLIQKAEEEKLLHVTIKLPEVVLEKLISDSHYYYLSDGVSRSAQLWNEQRKMIIHDAFYNFLLPSMEKEARLLLTSRAKAWLQWEYGRLLWNKVSVAPYQHKGSDLSSDEEAAPRIMACCRRPGKPATTFVMLDSAGEVIDVLHADSLCIRGQSFTEQQRKKNDQQQVQKFMDHQPHILVLGAANISCTELRDEIYELIFKIVEDNPCGVGEKMYDMVVVYGDESLPHLYETSHISVAQLPKREGIIRRAVGLGRYLQNPLAMIATLCGSGREVLSWKLSPLENFLTPDEKYYMIEQVMVDVTNQVGIDLNFASRHVWLFAPLQFISGLGPQKAASLQRSLVRAGTIYTRDSLLTSHALSEKVFFSAAGFLRVQRRSLTSSSNLFINLLDDTRIHPESYSLARDMAKTIYLDNGDVLRMCDIKHAKKNPHLLKTVDVRKYAERKNLLNKLETLNDIRLELIKSFQDPRRPYEEPNQDELFYMISGESEETLSEGKIVQVTVCRVQAQGAVCVLECGLNGILSKKDYADDLRDINDLTEKLHEGDILSCRIKSIRKSCYQVFLTCRESELTGHHHNNRSMDPYYHEEHITSQNHQEKTHRVKELAKKHFKPTANCAIEDAEEGYSGFSDGEVATSDDEDEDEDERLKRMAEKLRKKIEKALQKEKEKLQKAREEKERKRKEKEEGEQRRKEEEEIWEREAKEREEARRLEEQRQKAAEKTELEKLRQEVAVRRQEVADLRAASARLESRLDFVVQTICDICGRDPPPM